MPAGIAATVDNGFATLDFIDPTKRGPALAALMEIGGPESIETITRDGPRRKYRVPAGNATEAGLLDGDEEGREWSAGNDTGFAAKAVAADPNVNAGSDNVDWHTPVDQYTSANKFVGQVPNSQVLHGRPQVNLAGANGYGTSFGGDPDTGTHRELIDYVKEAEDEAYANSTPPIEQNLMSVSNLNTMLKSQPAALGTDPGAQPVGGGESLAEDYTSVQASREGVDAAGDSNEPSPPAVVTNIPGTVQANGDVTAPTVVEGASSGDDETTPADTEDVVEYPQGTPSDTWLRSELDAYALKVKGLDTTNEPNKAAVLAAINAAP